MALLAGVAAGRAETGATDPNFSEVYRIVTETLGSDKQAVVNRAAVNGLLRELQSRVYLVTNNLSEPPAAKASAALVKAAPLEQRFGYFRFAEVTGGLTERFRTAYEQINSTNKLRGVVIDLRFARGTDYEEASRLADEFVAGEEPLLQWASTHTRSHAKTNAISVPLALLVNAETGGASEAFAAAMRRSQVGLIIGSQTSGTANTYQEFPLKTGQKLMVANAPVRLGNGDAISDEGLKPDIEVLVALDEERRNLEDAYRVPEKPVTAPADTNLISSATGSRRRINEAELVRMQREGTSLDGEPAKTARDAETLRLISDPPLARAVDLLKGLAIVNSTRAN
jgi:C-terminal processing protease CtpA/Prc